MTDIENNLRLVFFDGTPVIFPLENIMILKFNYYRAVGTLNKKSPKLYVEPRFIPVL